MTGTHILPNRKLAGETSPFHSSTKVKTCYGLLSTVVCPCSHSGVNFRYEPLRTRSANPTDV